MPVVCVIGDIFATPGIEYYAHGCNCAGAMGAGIAVPFKNRWPRMYSRYALHCHDGKFTVGKIHRWTDGVSTIFNLGTQEHWKTPASTEDLYNVLLKLRSHLEANNINGLVMPLLGGGLGGLPPNKARQIVYSALGDMKQNVYLVDKYMPGKAIQYPPF